ncbi:MAG: hypothetical protein Q8K18_18520 [Burkholderiales bacterium]|nr:hypothetical protein [Burkholderiales bacterium]
MPLSMNWRYIYRYVIVFSGIIAALFTVPVHMPDYAPCRFLSARVPRTGVKSGRTESKRVNMGLTAGKQAAIKILIVKECFT